MTHCSLCSKLATNTVHLFEGGRYFVVNFCEEHSKSYKYELTECELHSLELEHYANELFLGNLEPREVEAAPVPLEPEKKLTEKESLVQQMHEFIKNEEYSKAAEIRDILRSMESQNENQS